jgi:hypothetical protein
MIFYDIEMRVVVEVSVVVSFSVDFYQYMDVLALIFVY